MNAAARFWSYLTSLNAVRPRSSDRTAGGGPSQYAMWLERDCPCGVSGCGVCAAAGRERDWLGADLYHRQRGGPR